VAKRYRKPFVYIIATLLLLSTFLAMSGNARAQGTPTATLRVLNRHGIAVEALTDGDVIRAQLTLGQSPTNSATVSFTLDTEAHALATCTIHPGAMSCETTAFPALGWYWRAGQPQPYRQVRATLLEVSSSATTTIRVAPRPVILVHGFISHANAWDSYTKTDGFLASLGLHGYAVGDSQAAGVMQTGDLAQPTLPTHSIAENAAILMEYIAGVKQRTGAEQVDVVAHSMGGLITRYYIDRLMSERDVAQLLMLGTPHGGSACAELPASLGFYLPAALELRPTYMREVFNRQIARRHGVPMYQLAGNLIGERFRAPCTMVPSDLIVDRASSATIGAPLTELPALHTSLPLSEKVFTNFVAPHLQTPAGQFVAEPDAPPPATAAEPVQFTQVTSGQVAAGARKTITINLDRVAVASFALFDPTRSLGVEVRGASGRRITLRPSENGTIVVDDPAALVHLGYGFNNPAPGPWTVTLVATAATPPAGAPYALSTQVVGGARLQAGVKQMVPELHETVVVTANLELANQLIADVALDAVIRAPDGSVQQRALIGTGAEKRVAWVPTQVGLHSINITARGRAADGAIVERMAFLAFEVQPSPNLGQRNLLVLVAGITALIAGLGIRNKRRHRSS
jgi:pimeloyl-ACP methyl ester carboxylesterase